MKTLDTYQNLCTEVYDLSKPNAPEDAYPFYRSYVQEANGLILEPMCGTGRFLLPLAEERFNIHGFDASESMLQKLHIKARAKNLKPTVWHGFVEDLKRAEKYGLIFIPSGSFCLITDLEVVKNALKIIYEHLVDNGLFVFEVETVSAVSKELGLWRGSRWVRADGKMILLSSFAVLNEDLCYSIGKYELINENQVIATEVEEYKIRIYDDPNLLLELLKTIGFNDVRLLKAFDRSAKPQVGDERIVYECRK